MHTLGKVLMFFVIVGALAGAYLSARLLDTRYQWMSRVESKSRLYQENVLKLADARRRANDRKSQVNRLRFAFGGYIVADDAQPAQGATIHLNIGSDDGLAASDFAAGRTPSVHLFHVNEQGGSQYLGHFIIDTLDADQAGATLSRETFRDVEGNDETASWPAGTYRVRTTIVAPWSKEFTTLWSDYGSILQTHDAELAMEARQQRARADATTQLDERMQELQGHTDAPPDAGIVERVGIVEAMRLAEISRDAVLAELDALRQEYSEKHFQLQALLESNGRRRELLDPPPVTSNPEGDLEPVDVIR